MSTNLFAKITAIFCNIREPERDEMVPAIYSPHQGLPTVSVERLLDTHTEHLRRLRNNIPLSEEEYGELVVPTIRRFAEFAHLAPASQAHHHDQPGGLLAHSLEVAHYSARAAKGSVWDNGQLPERRYKRGPAWILAAALGGLLHDAGKLITDVAISDQHSVWNPAEKSLVQWADDVSTLRYFIEWLPDRHERHIWAWSAIGPSIIDKAFATWLGQPDFRDIHLEFYGALTGKNGKLVEIIRHADGASVDKALREGRATRNDGIFSPPSSQFACAFTTLISSGALAWNKPGQPLWHLVIQNDCGVYAAWPAICDRITSHLREAGSSSIPSPTDMLAKLLERGLVVAGPDGSSTVTLCVEGIQKPLKFARFDIDRLSEITRGRIVTPAVETAVPAVLVDADHQGTTEQPPNDQTADFRFLVAAILRGEELRSGRESQIHDLSSSDFDELAKKVGLPKGEVYKRLQESSLAEISRLPAGFVRITFRST